MRQRKMGRGAALLLAAMLAGALVACGSGEGDGASGLSVSGGTAQTTTQTVGSTCSPVNVRATSGTRSTVPQHPCVPALAYDDTSITLAWNKPDIYADVADYTFT